MIDYCREVDPSWVPVLLISCAPWLGLTNKAAISLSRRLSDKRKILKGQVRPYTWGPNRSLSEVLCARVRAETLNLPSLAIIVARVDLPECKRD